MEEIVASGECGTSGLSSMSNNPMLNAKLTRIKVQQDVELLTNRVERLRAEERKAKQKVLETKLRGQEIVALQKRNEQLAEAKQLAKQMEEEQRRREVQQVTSCLCVENENFGLLRVILPAMYSLGYCVRTRPRECVLRCCIRLFSSNNQRDWSRSRH